MTRTRTLPVEKTLTSAQQPGRYPCLLGLNYLPFESPGVFAQLSSWHPAWLFRLHTVLHPVHRRCSETAANGGGEGGEGLQRGGPVYPRWSVSLAAPVQSPTAQASSMSNPGTGVSVAMGTKPPGNSRAQLGNQSITRIWSLSISQTEHV